MDICPVVLHINSCRLGHGGKWHGRGRSSASLHLDAEMAEWRILFRLLGQALRSQLRCTKVRRFVAAVSVFIFGRTAACLYYGDPGRSMLDASLVCTCLLGRTVSIMRRTM